MKTLPEEVVNYYDSPEFSETSIPEGLLKSHRTKVDNWAKIIVLEGRLRYRILEPKVEEVTLSPERPGIVEPEVAHEVEAIGKVRFRIKFYR